MILPDRVKYMVKGRRNKSFVDQLKDVVRRRPALGVEHTGQKQGYYKEAMGWYNDPQSYDPIQQTYNPTNSFFNYPYGIYDEMKGKNTHVRAMLDTRVQTIISKPIRILPANITREALKRRDFVVDMLDQMGRGKAAGDFLHFLKNIQFNGIFYPFTAAEIMWKYNGTSICPDEIKVRHPRNFSWNKEGDKLEFLSTNGLQPLANGKFIIYAPLRENDHPYKGGLSPLLYSIHNLMWLNLKWWGTANERGGIPIIMVQGADYMSEPEKDKMETTLDGLKNNIYALIPDGVDVQSFESRMRAATNTFQDMASFCKREISLAVLGETLTAESGASGSYSLGAVHQDTLASFVQYDAPQLMEMVNGSIIPLMIAYNFPPKMVDGRLDWLLPKFVLEFEPPEDMQKRLLLDQGALAMGVELSKSYIREKYNIPKPIDEDDELVKAEPGVGNLPSQDPATTNKPGVDNRDDPSKDLKDKAGPGTNKGRGVNDKVKATAAGFISDSEGVRSLDVMDEMIGTLESASVEQVDKVNQAFQRWIDKFDTLEDIKAVVNNSWSELEIEISEFEEFIRNGIFQSFALGYHQLFDDPRVRVVAVEDEIKDTAKVSAGVFRPDEIIAIFEARKILERAEYDQLLVWARARAFTVAGKTKEEILDVIKPLVREGIYTGKNKEWFVAQTETVLKAGHAKTIFQTNFATAYNYGRADAVFDPGVRGIFAAASYYVVDDDRTTDICRALIGKIIPLSEMLHGQFVPPLHFNCRTVMVFLTHNQYGKVLAPDVFTYEKQLDMPESLKPQGDFGYYSPVLHIGKVY